MARRKFLSGFRRKLRASIPTEPLLPFDGVGGDRRSRAYVPSALSSNVINQFFGDELERKAHDLVRRNPWAKSGARAWQANLIGTGIRPQSRADDEEFRTEAEALWNEWIHFADTDGTTDFYGLQALAARAAFVGGDAFLRLRPRPLGGRSPVPFQLQLLEAQQLPRRLNQNAPNGNNIRQGIEFNDDGERVAYRFFRIHPGEFITGRGLIASLADTVRIPASEILHVYTPTRPGQIRGESEFAAELQRIFELDKWDDAELLRKQTTSLFAGFITKSGVDDEVIPGTTVDIDEPGVGDAVMEPGTLQQLSPGEQITFSQPAGSGAGEKDWLNHQLRAIAAGMGVTFEQLTGDLSSVNFSSIRAGLIEFRRVIRQHQQSFTTHQLCRPTWERFVRIAILVGALDAPDFFRDPAAFLKVAWQPPGFEYVDPQKEVMADKIAIRGGLVSRSQSLIARGFDPEEVDAQMARDNVRADELGLVLDTDPRRTTNAGLRSVSADDIDGDGGSDDDAEEGSEHLESEEEERQREEREDRGE